MQKIKLGRLKKNKKFWENLAAQKKKKGKTKTKKKLGRKLANKFPQLPHFHREHWVHWMPEIRSPRAPSASRSTLPRAISLSQSTQYILYTQCNPPPHPLPLPAISSSQCTQYTPHPGPPYPRNQFVSVHPVDRLSAPSTSIQCNPHPSVRKFQTISKS